MALGTRYARPSRKEYMVKRWQIANVGKMGMERVVEEGNKMYKMSIEELFKYLKSLKK